ELDNHSLSEADPSESSPPPVSIAPMVSPFLCSDDSESDTEIPERHVSPTTSTPEIPTAPILPASSAIETDITQRTKRKPKTNKTKHGMEKAKSNQSQSQSKSKSQQEGQPREENTT
ncbi:hypothetical protein Tco_1412391, partial [Tanacetum coccineum]